MTTAQAILVLRRLQDEADRDWPHGFDRERVVLEAKDAVFVLVLDVEAQPENQRAARAKEYLRAIATPYRATVAPRRRYVETVASL